MLNPIEEEKYLKLKKINKELKLMSMPEVFINLQTHDVEGNLMFEDKQRGHSWIRNVWNINTTGWLMDSTTGSTYAVGSLAKKDLSGSLATATSYYRGGTRYYFDTSTKSWFIIVGTSDEAWSSLNYKLGTQIADGDGAGLLRHQAGIFGTASYSSGDKTWTRLFSRVFNNNSGGAITVKEVGLFTYIITGDSPTYYDAWILYERSVLAPTVTVVNGAQLTVTYEIMADFSSVD